MHYLVIQAGKVNCLPACETECIQENTCLLGTLARCILRLDIGM